VRKKHKKSATAADIKKTDLKKRRIKLIRR
jgi:hypothetical protein